MRRRRAKSWSSSPWPRAAGCMRGSAASRRPTSKDRTVCASPVSAKLSPRLGILILLGVGSAFAANHVSARVAFDHGASVAVRLPRTLRPQALLAGLLIATQSYSLYSAVALIPPALALLVFQTSPMLYVLLTWALGKESPRWSALPPMLLALVGLAFALDVRTGDNMAEG